ncbi:hypothetical protein Tco_0344981 [Tanacetum coccineum]
MLAATWSLRPDGYTLDSYKEYCNHPTAFTLKINHGGQLTCPPNVRYIGGKSNWFDDVDADTFSTIEVQTMVKDLGYIHTDLMLYYKIPKLPLHNGLKSLACDKDVMEMCQYVSQCKLMEVFVIHPISKPDHRSGLTFFSLKSALLRGFQWSLNNLPTISSRGGERHGLKTITKGYYY